VPLARMSKGTNEWESTNFDGGKYGYLAVIRFRSVRFRVPGQESASVSFAGRELDIAQSSCRIHAILLTSIKSLGSFQYARLAWSLTTVRGNEKPPRCVSMF